MNHVAWALIGIVGYSLTTFLVKRATRVPVVSPGGR
jgi:hypothetical protein